MSEFALQFQSDARPHRQGPDNNNTNLRNQFHIYKKISGERRDLFSEAFVKSFCNIVHAMTLSVYNVDSININLGLISLFITNTYGIFYFDLINSN